MGEEESFVDVGLNDAEPVDAFSGEKNEEANGKHRDPEQPPPNPNRIIVELPESFGVQQNGRSPVNLDQPSTASSSFVPLSAMGKLQLQSDTSTVASNSCSHSFQLIQDGKPRAIDSPSASDWSVLSSNLYSHPPSATNSVSSNISGFELLGIKGSVVRRCNRCSFHNSNQDSSCQMCDLPLLVPNVDIDTQIAMSLQRKEENMANQLWLQDQQKRKLLPQMTLFEQSQSLSEYICSTVNNMKASRSTEDLSWLRVLHARDFTFCGTDFISSVSSGSDFQFPEKAITVWYCFTAKGSRVWNTICQNGLGCFTRVFSDVEVAYQSYCSSQGLGTCNHLPTISEHDEDSPEEDHRENISLGWIVATNAQATYGFGEAPKWDEKLSCFTKVAGAALPLACFEASKRNHNVIAPLAKNLDDITQDFFCSLLGLVAGIQDAIAPSSPKKQKTDDAANATATSNGSVDTQEATTPTELHNALAGLSIWNMPRSESSTSLNNAFQSTCRIDSTKASEPAEVVDLEKLAADARAALQMLDLPPPSDEHSHQKEPIQSENMEAPKPSTQLGIPTLQVATTASTTGNASHVDADSHAKLD